jgi:CDP-diacylglycerol--glycerol-3-phosphate 3-phosphatidyltransferase
MEKFVDELKSFLENLNKEKDQFLFRFINPYWPRSITPNYLTMVRIAIGIFLLVLLFDFRNDNGLIIIPFFLIGAATDLLDGAVARCLGMESKFGQITDPIADRILIIPIALYSLMDHPYLLSLLLSMEIINALISLVAVGKKIFFGTNIFGKTKMFLQSLVFIGILVFWPHSPNFFFTYVLWLSLVLMLISTALKINHLKLYYVQKYKSV